jgi:hypothetical protein
MVAVDNFPLEAKCVKKELTGQVADALCIIIILLLLL